LSRSVRFIWRPSLQLAAVLEVPSLGLGWEVVLGELVRKGMSVDASRQLLHANLEALWATARQAAAGGAPARGLTDGQLETLAALAPAVSALGTTRGEGVLPVGPCGAFSAAPTSDDRRSVYIGGVLGGVDAKKVEAAASLFGAVAAVELIDDDAEVTAQRVGRPIPMDLPAGRAKVTFVDESAAEQLAATRYLELNYALAEAAAVVCADSAGPRSWTALTLTADAEAEAQTLWEALPAELRLHFLTPLGDFDSAAFAFAVLRLAPASVAFMQHVSAVGADGSVPDGAVAAELWAEVPLFLQANGRAMWPTAADAAAPAHVVELYRSARAVDTRREQLVMADRLDRELLRYQLAEEWAIKAPQRKPYNYAALKKKLGTLATVPRGDTGAVLDPSDVAKLEVIRDSLPPSLSAGFESARGDSLCLLPPAFPFLLAAARLSVCAVTVRLGCHLRDRGLPPTSPTSASQCQLVPANAASASQCQPVPAV
jgi:hypothetical protein